MTDNLTFAEKAADKAARAAAINRWPAALLQVRKATGKSVSKICEEILPLDDTALNHILAGRRGANWDTIRAVDAAFRTVLGPEKYPENTAMDKLLANR